MRYGIHRNRTLVIGLGLALWFGSVWGAGCRPRKAPITRPRQPRKSPGMALYKVLKGGGKQKVSKDVVVERRDTRIRFAKNGAATFDYRVRVRLLTKDGVSSWQFFSASWSPWYERRPRISARITLPVGKTLELDPKTIGEETARPSNWHTLTDRRRLRAPLPGLEVGAVINLRVVQQEKHPRLGSGDLHQVFLAPVMPTKLHRITIEAPTSLTLKWQVRGLALKPQSDRTAKGVRRVVLEAGPFEKNPLWEAFMPPDAVGYPHLQLSTVARWKDVATAYHRLSRDRLRSPGATKAVAAVRKGGATKRTRLIAALLARLQKKIRYTALTFGQGAIRPHRPDATTKRGYGDCKDMSALLVAWLHAAGIPAHLALVRASYADLNPDLPGLAAFNHAIVHVPGSPPLWIDPTARYTSLQTPPYNIQGHWALVIRPQTTGLVRIPASKATDNVFHEIRNVRFAPQIGGHVVEETHSTGSFQTRLRRLVGGQEPAQLRKQMESFIRRSYHSDKLVSIRHGEASRLDIPLRLRLEMRQADVAWTDDEHAKLGLDISLLWTDVPGYLKYPPKPGSKQAKRKQDFYWRVPHEARITYRITPPPGYAISSRPEASSFALGPARISWQVRLDKKTQRLELSYQLHTGKRRYRPAEVKAFWKGMRRFNQSVKINKVIYEHRGHTLRKAGKYKAALDIYRRLLKRWPDNATYYRQIANFYSGIGFGLKARAILRKAIQRMPKDPVGHYMLGIHLEHDALGNESTDNWDRQATIAAYRRAQQLDPKNAFYPLALGRVLSIDKHGNDLTTAKALAPALKVLLTMREKLKDTSMDNRIARLLLYARRHDELRKHARLLERGPYRNSVEVTNLTVEKGFGAGLSLARRLAPEQGAFKALASLVGVELLRLSEHALARKFMLLGIGDSLQERGRARSVKQIRSMRHLARTPRSATHLAQQFFWLAYSGQITRKRIDQMVARRMSAPVRKTLYTMTDRISRGAIAAVRRHSDFPPLVMADLIMSQLKTRAQGNDRLGYRVEILVASRGAKLVVYIIKSGKQYRIRALDGVSSALGNEILYLIRKGRLGHARKWLDWARGSDEPDAHPMRGSTFDHFYTAGRQAPKERLRLAAALLAIRGNPIQKRAVRIIEGGLRRRWSKADLTQLRRALLVVYFKQHRYRKAAAISATLMKAYGSRLGARLAHITTLLVANRVQEASRLARKLQRDEPTRWQSYLALSEVAQHRRRYREALKQLRRATSLANVSPRIYNLSAWVSLFLKGPLPKTAIQHALQAVRLSNYGASHILHTLATVYAEVGELHSARLALSQAIKMAGRKLPEKSDWYPYGRIAEHLGFREEALAAYRKIEKPKRTNNTSSWLLAQRRLKILQRKARPKKPGK